jgi:virginiamycin A acetyltransferase
LKDADLSMRFEQVVTGVASGRLRADRSIPRSCLVELDHILSASIPAEGYFFEAHSQLSSPIVRNKNDPPTNFVGAYSYINSGGYLRDHVVIGRYCSIGRRVTIAAGNHPVRTLSTSPRLRGSDARPYSTEESASVYRPAAAGAITVIESDVWIGDGAVIKAGIRLGIGTVVGANAVVVRDTKPYEIVGGVAAKSLGFRFAPAVIDALLRSEWWERDLAVLDRYPAANVFEFLEAFERDRPPPHEFSLYLCGG